MMEESADQSIKLPAWFVRGCKWCWIGRRFLFGTVLLSIVLNLVAALPLVDPSALQSLPVAWLASHLPLLLGIFTLLLLLTILCGLIARLSAPLSNRELRVRYLEQMTRDTELSTLKGIPAGLISESVRLVDIYIPPRFYTNRARVDFPVTDEDLARYRQSLKQGLVSPDLERVVFEAEKNWLHILKKGDRVELDAVWQQVIKNDAVVIQGYPGMGKSTLMERLSLHLAARCLHQPDPEMPEGEKLIPALMPVLLRLGSYARALVEKPDLSLSKYLFRVLDDMHLPGLATFMQQKLQDGACLVMLDGLDEVSEPERREQVQREIRNLISGSYHRCHFIITSRVAGYDQAAFPAYPHFTLAELTDKEIDFFLPRWCRANLDRDSAFRAASMKEPNITREVERQTRELITAIKDNQSVRDLAQNPLLLTLLLVMQQNSIVLPRQRVELYDTVTKTLLENRNLAKDLEGVPEFQAIERLGPLAFKMQEADSDLVRQRDVEEALIDVIRHEGGTEVQARTEAQRFLLRVRERGGLFVSRVGDYFGFMHRTFQEYFAARYILNKMKTDRQRWIGELVQRARRQDALWREPFLLAVAYQSKENEHIASEILSTLLAEASRNSFEQEISVVLLATAAIIEAKPLALKAELQEETAERLLNCYERAKRSNNARACKNIENLTQRWLCSLPKEAYRLPLLDVFSRAIKDTQQVARQRTVLTLLTLIAPGLESCSELVFEQFIPLLLALTHLPTIGPYSQTSDLVTVTPDFDVADLALCVLTFLGKRGPAGLYQATVQDYFDKRPAHLRSLARYSLECGTLITPIVPPLAAENYRQYEAAIERWIKLRKQTQQHITEQNVVECLTIQRSLLACAEKVSYPTTQHLLAMLELSEAYTEQPWSEIWQAYLLEQLNTGSYIDYHEVTLLWNALFPKNQLQPLVDRITRHYTASDPVRKRYAQRLISYFSSYLTNLSYLSYLSYLRYLTNLSYLSYLSNLSNLRYLSNLSYLSYLSDLSYLTNLTNLSYLSNLLITREVVEIARMSLPASKGAEKIDLLTVLQGRILQFQANNVLDSDVETEIQLLARAARQELSPPGIDEEVQKAALGMLRVLPTRTVVEIKLIWEILGETRDKQIQDALAYALRNARPLDDAAWQELEKGGSSMVKAVRDAVQEALERREAEKLRQKRKRTPL